MANKAHGEIEALIAGQKRKLRLGIGDLINLEDAIDAGCMEIARMLSSGSFRTRTIVLILMYGLNGAGARVKETEVIKMLEEDGGPLDHLKTCSELLATALVSGSDDEDAPSGNAEAAAET